MAPSTQVCNLGIILNPTLSFLPHANHITKTAFFHLRTIACLRPSLSSATTEILIHALITSRLDYCNSILYGSPNTILNKRSELCRCSPPPDAMNTSPRSYATSTKILLTTYKALNNLAPSYLSNLLPLKYYYYYYYYFSPGDSLSLSQTNTLIVQYSFSKDKSDIKTGGLNAIKISRNPPIGLYSHKS